VKTEELLTYPWPFPQWDGTRLVMPLELAPEDVRLAEEKVNPLAWLEDAPEAPF
jgi:hypothetical protein